MKKIIEVSSIFVLLIMAVSCASTPGVIPAKYNLDNSLEAVDRISTFKVSSWEQVDRQSIILKVNYNDYYLLVLRRPIISGYPNLRIGVERTIFSITAGFDRIVVLELGAPDYYVIDKIYKLKDKEQAKEIKEKLTKK
ncbi:DUF6491 family protein [Thermodesulfobacteriota bacterium]